jgi:hypothetical protein
MTKINDQLTALSKNNQEDIAKAIQAAHQAFHASTNNLHLNLKVAGLVFHNDPTPGGPPNCNYCPVTYPGGVPALVCCP